ncbi:MAG: DUF5053 domain-containing protein [Bacteroidales bacterium]|nr:DUF5053 domain-containing protein [Bacteroidales bacterium]
MESTKKDNEIITLRQVKGADVLDILNCAGISEKFFNRSRAWFIQRLNNNIVNGKPVSFTPAELFKLRTALKILASEITDFTTNIPNLPTDMAIKVYVIDNPEAIQYFINDDVEGFKEYLASDDMFEFPEPEFFDTEAEALAFCSGIGYGADERATPDRYPLRSCEEADLPFIEALENYLEY